MTDTDIHLLEHLNHKNKVRSENYLKIIGQLTDNNIL